MTLIEYAQSANVLLIAPAGHGKTHAIAECVGVSHTVKQLILTHTHAGIASIKQKMDKLHVPSQIYDIQTISGFAQKLVFAYIGQSNLKHKQEDGGVFFMEILDKCITLLKLQSVSSVITQTYKGLYVDEYQDCNRMQHSLIMALSDLVPTRLLGDPLQGIYDFDDDKIDFTKDLSHFTIEDDLLNVPQRWSTNDNCVALGDKIFKIRHRLLSPRNDFTLVHDENAHFHLIVWDKDKDLYYYHKVGKLLRKIRSDSVLLIIPQFIEKNSNIPRGYIDERAKLRKRLGIDHDFKLIEAIDDKSFYSVSKAVDTLLIDIKKARKKIKKIFEVIEKFNFNSTEIKPWFSEDLNGLKPRKKDNKRNSEILESLVNSFLSEVSLESFYLILRFFMSTLKLQSRRPELLFSVSKCIENAIENGESVYSNMCSYKNKIRVIGRKVEGKYIGTTLLTKGLEFDDVVILDAQNFEDKRNFYVAISRACKNLYIITNNEKIHLEE